MKRVTENLTLLVAVVLLFASAGYSQSVQKMVIKANVPFEFTVRNKTFPAGKYFLERIAPNAIALRDGNNAILTSVGIGPVESLAPSETSKLKFEYRDGRYVLSEVWANGTTTGYQVSMPKRLATLAQQKSVATEVQASALSSNGK